MHLSQKQKKYAQFFCPVLQSTLNFAHFQEKMTLVAYVFPKLRTPKLVVREISKKTRFRGAVDSQHGKRAEKLFKFQRENLYHTYRSMRR